ncbi:hypothetical protein BH09ACT5_BH09ACT5_04520 [soil metagenome]
MPRSRVLLALPVLAIVLAGFVPTPVPTPDPGSSGGLPSSTATPSPTPSATATPTPGPDTEPVTFGCSDAISAQVVYDFNPNVTLLSDFSPAQGTTAAQAVAQQGLACRLINQSSGEPIDIGVVHYTETGYAAKLASLASATTTDMFDGYFDVVDGAGFAQVVSKPYWVFVSAPGYTDPRDLAPIITSVRDSVG